MKTYTKPSIEVISMKTTENIAANNYKTIYKKAVDGSTYARQTIAKFSKINDLKGSTPNA